MSVRNFILNKWTKGLLLSVFSFLFLWFYLDKWSKRHGFDGASDFVYTVGGNYWSSLDADYKTIEITISNADYEKLDNQRKQHLARGMIVKGNDRFIPAIISYNGKKIKSKIRLKGHMTDHLQDKKWSFRVKTNGDNALFGMKSFTLQHPGTRNYIYEWIYHKLLEDENIATVRYSFLNVKLNGESWGIYALEEHFDSELLHYRKLPDGPILGFNPEMYWFARLNELDHIYVDLHNFNFNSTYPEAYNENIHFKTAEKRQIYSEAIIKFNQFIKGEKTVSETFDIEKLARFHAIIDLVGGQFSLDWSDVKYYYNPVTRLLEPVGYESFSFRNTENLAGAYKFSLINDNNSSWHSLLFSDGDFFTKYIIELKRVSKKKYLEKFFERYDNELRSNLDILYTEFPYKKFDFSGYFNNQKNINKLLESPASHGLYLESFRKDTLVLTCVSTSAYPFEVKKIIINDSFEVIPEKLFLPAREIGNRVKTELIKIPISFNGNKENAKILFEISIPGISKKIKLKLKPIRTDNYNFNYEDELNFASNHTDFKFMRINENQKTIFFDTGIINIRKSIRIPKGYKVLITSPCTINLFNNSAIITSSPILINGTEDSPIYFNSPDSSGKGIILLNLKLKSVIKNVVANDFYNKYNKRFAFITAYNSEFTIENCIFNVFNKYILYVSRSKIKIKNSTFSGGELAIYSEFSDINLAHVDLLNLKRGIILDACNGKIQLTNCSFTKEAFKIVKGCKILMNEIKINKVSTAFKIFDFSNVRINNIAMNDVKNGFIVGSKSDVFGPSFVEVNDLKNENIKMIKKIEKGSILKFIFFEK